MMIHMIPMYKYDENESSNTDLGSISAFLIELFTKLELDLSCLEGR